MAEASKDVTNHMMLVQWHNMALRPNRGAEMRVLASMDMLRPLEADPELKAGCRQNDCTLMLADVQQRACS